MPEFRSEITFPIYYDETDLSGLVYHANYAKFFDRGRQELLGIEFLKELYERGVHFVAREMSIRFLKPLRLGDQATIVSKCSFSKGPRVPFHHEARKGSEVMAEGDIELVCVNQDGKPIRLPSEFIWSLADRQT